MKLAIILTEEFADWECALLMASARTEFGFEIVTASPGGKPVMSMGGLKTTPDRAAEGLDPASFDALVLCGGMIWETEAAPDLSPLIRAFRAQRRVVAGICGATLALVRAGVLDDVGHTGNTLQSLKDVPDYDGADLYRDVPQAVCDDNVVTAAGTAPVTFTAEIYKALGFGSEELTSYMKLYGAEHGPQAAA